MRRTNLTATVFAALASFQAVAVTSYGRPQANVHFNATAEQAGLGVVAFGAIVVPRRRRRTSCC